MQGKEPNMLRITMSKSAAGAKKYYCEEYYQEGYAAQHNYYSEHDEAIGRWGGAAAAKLGLVGDIKRQDFAKLCDNINPVSGDTLTPRNDVDRTVGYDFTFNASKSVSLAYALGSDSDKQEILAAFQRAVRETMYEVEQDMQARVRANGKNENRITGNIAYGAFTHFTTRPIDGIPDPHLHSHCFVFNATYDREEQKWKAGQFKQLKQDAPYYEALFHSNLANRLQRLGYNVAKTDNAFELIGLEKSTLQKFSRRTQEIEDYSKEHHITDEAQKSQVGAKTREAKRSDVTAEQKEAAWLDRLSPDELATIKQLKGSNAPFPQPSHEAAEKALQFALNHHLERKSVASDKEILATAIKAGIGKATAQQVREVFESDANILAANEQLRTYITTKQSLNEEKLLIKNCIASRNKFQPIYENYVPENPLLNEQQKAAVKHALASTDGITIITGKAGTGKTTLMKEVRHGILQTGKQIFAFAPSSEASRSVQRSEGFENADTVARLLVDEMLQIQLKRQVIWIDEAGMLSNRDMNKIIAVANTQQARIILSGDTKQHNSVERGDALRIIQQETGIRPVTVSKIQRQKNVEYKEAVQLLSNGCVEKGFKQLDRMGAIHEMTESRERVKAIADEYYSSAYAGNGQPVKEVLVIAPTHAEGELVTARIRQKLKDEHVISRQDREYQTLKNRQLTEAEKQVQESYRPGDVLEFHQNAKGIKAGKRLEILSADETGVTAKDSTGKPYNIPLAEAQKFSAFEVRPLTVSAGDKIRITANGKANDGKYLFNGSTFTIEGFDEQGGIRLSNDSTIAHDFGHFNLGYVSTSHASQGKTADKVIISQSSATFRASSMEQFYVSVSRGKQAVSIYTDDKEHLQQAVSQSVERKSATELIAKRQAQMREINRNTLFRTWQETEMPAYLIAKTKEHGLQAEARGE